MAKVIDAVLKLTDQFTPVLKNAQKAISQTSKQAIRAGKEIQKVGKNIEKTGKTLTATITAPLAAIGAASIKTTMDFDASMSKVQALSGATGAQLEELRQKCIELGGSTAWSASQVSEAMQFMSLAGWNSKQMLEGTKGIMDAASASGEDLATVCDIITDGLSAFGMEARESTRFADVLAKTAASSNTTIGMMGEAFTYAGSVAGAFNYNIEDTAIAIGLMANSGIKASQAGTALRKMLTKMTGTVEITGKNLGKYVVQVANADGKMQPLRDTIVQLREAFSMLTEAEKATEAEAIAGKTGMAGLLAVVNASEDSFNALVNSIDNSTGAAAEMSDVMLNNLSGQITIIKSGLESLAISIGTLLTPSLSKIAVKVQDLVTKFNNLSDEQKMQVVKWAGIAASIGPALIVFGKITKTIGKAVLMFGKFGKAIKGIKTMKAALALILSPANVVILVLAGIALATVLVIKNWEKLKTFFINVSNTMKERAEVMGFGFDRLKESWTTLKDNFCDVWGGIKQFFADHSDQIQIIVQALGITFSAIFNGILSLIVGVVGGISNIISDLLGVFNGIIDFIAGVFTLDWERAWGGIKDIFFNIFKGLVDFFTGVMGSIAGAIQGVVSTIRNGISGTKASVDVSANVSNIPNMPNVQAYATGTNNFGGGLAQVHEKGGEIIDLPRGSRIYPHDESVNKAYKDGAKSSQGFTIAKLADTIVVREDADIDKIADSLYRKFKKQALNMT